MLGRRDRERIRAAIATLPEGDIKRLRGGNWRVLFGRRESDRVIDVLAVRPRGRAYRS